MDLANWALRTSLKFATGVKCQFHQVFLTRKKSCVCIRPHDRSENFYGDRNRFDAEKKLIYEPTIDFYKDKYHLESITITGLMVGARGTIPKFVSDYCKTFGLYKEILIDISIAALKGSIAIFRNHTYHS